MAKVVVGLSGGVDSSVTAYLLKEQGHEVIGIFMRNWVDDSVIISEDCPWVEDSNDALLVAEKLGIPFQTIDFSTEYKERIVDYMFREYEQGRTPNPDVLCNREVKFDIFLKKALELGADFVATGHYCRKDTIDVDGKPIYRLLGGKDPSKDQSYFLCQVNQEQLSKALFPIGELLKSEVRKIAKEQGLITAEKKDSQGLCFIGKVRLPDFLQQQLKPKEGVIIEIDGNDAIYDAITRLKLEEKATPFIYNKNMGKIVGKHQGAHYFTIGQRKGMNVGGNPLPLFVIATDTKENIIFVGQGDHHAGLYRSALFIPNVDVHWIRKDLQMKVGDTRPYKARIRYRQNLENCTLHCNENGVYIEFEKLQRGITPGQFAAWYNEDELIGSGVIA